MKTLDQYNKLKKENNNSLVIIKEGIFYKTFNYDALILWYIFDYKYINNCTSFGSNCLDKVTDKLKKIDLSYIIYNSDDKTTYHGDDEVYNHYKELSIKSHNKIKMEEKLIELLKEALAKDSNNYDKINNFLEKI